MTARIEARRLSGVDIGKTVSVGEHVDRTVVIVEHSADGVALIFDIDGIRGTQVNLAPTDLVTITGRDETTGADGQESADEPGGRQRGADGALRGHVGFAGDEDGRGHE